MESDDLLTQNELAALSVFSPDPETKAAAKRMLQAGCFRSATKEEGWSDHPYRLAALSPSTTLIDSIVASQEDERTPVEPEPPKPFEEPVAKPAPEPEAEPVNEYMRRLSLPRQQNVPVQPKTPEALKKPQEKPVLDLGQNESLY